MIEKNSGKLVGRLKHKTNHIVHGNMEADIDCDISNLILNLWKLDIHTTLSCQSNVPKNYVWIEFFSASDAEKFLDLTAEFDEDFDSIYQNMVSTWGDGREEWRYAVNVMDYGVKFIFDDNEEIIGEELDGEHTFIFAVSVRFPKKHLAFVESRIRKAVYDQSNSFVAEVALPEEIALVEE